MDLQLKDKTALVLGGGGGLGGAIARTLASEGVRVGVADIDLDAAEMTAQAVREAGSHAVALQWDLGDLSSADGHVTRIEKELGFIDVLVNNTGGPPPTPAHGQDAALWRKHFESMVLSVVSITDRVLPGMR
jgi:3-oxoacyl-[acyl-carrier protein] reductase